MEAAGQPRRVSEHVMYIYREREAAGHFEDPPLRPTYLGEWLHAKQQRRITLNTWLLQLKGAEPGAVLV